MILTETIMPVGQVLPIDRAMRFPQIVMARASSPAFHRRSTRADDR